MVATAPSRDGLGGMATETGALDSQLRTRAADVTSTEQMQALQQWTHQVVGPIDILVHAAGITGAQGLFHEIDEAGWQHTLDVDLMGAVRILQAFLPDQRRGWGRVVLVTSEDAVQPYVDELRYCAARPGSSPWPRASPAAMPPGACW